MAQLVVAPELSAVCTARHWVSDVVARCCATSGPQVDEDLVELLTSEVVANAVRHGQGPVTVEVACAEEHVRIAVTDASPTAPVVRHVGPEATGGRGMALTDLLATRWGVETAHPPARGKTVWFQLSGST
ncbi:ATP-binding protein [Paenibacillus sp. TRM 82003]|uniref:ATP-binding protein n=1 Tax=Kineococcus sp. TRM81007 TaxID=2925831 RepID=UPI001F5795E7|nr:ATP-binding protein [Kineococcus sp. TRM81007]MCI2239164.1 ATP-binding protein [Kineococcus sp. TRM81007]MCI3924843.1 ATP-binding protein [Paenibacillus sp. TRM 82003]